MSEERIATLEAYREGDVSKIAEIKTTVDEIHADVQSIKVQLAGQKGFLAGIMAVVLPLWTLVLMGLSAAYEWWKAQ